jgi:alkaline phosphatase
MPHRDTPRLSSRRQFLAGSALILAGTASRPVAWGDDAATSRPVVRIGLLTDIHYADKKSGGTRNYTASLMKVREAVAAFNKQEAQVAVELGDLIDSASDPTTEAGYLTTIEKELARFRGERGYVLGNHCVDGLTKQQFLDGCDAKATHRSFDVSGTHLVILDACFRADGVPYGRRNFDWTDANIPPDQLEWLAADLKATRLPTLVFVHQRLDVAKPFGIKNAPAVRAVLEKAGTVLAVFQGHNHINDLKTITGIPYLTLAATVEGDDNAYGLLDLFADGSMRLDGFFRQTSRKLPARQG